MSAVTWSSGKTPSNENQEASDSVACFWNPFVPPDFLMQPWWKGEYRVSLQLDVPWLANILGVPTCI